MQAGSCAKLHALTAPTSCHLWQQLCKQADPRERLLAFLEREKRGLLTFLLVWLALTTNLKIGVVYKENPAGRAITKLLGSLALDNEQAKLFVRAVSREEHMANAASTRHDTAQGPSPRPKQSSQPLAWWEAKRHMCILRCGCPWSRLTF